jgi:hypothetical protein
MFMFQTERRKYKRHMVNMCADFAFAKLWENVVEKGLIRDISYGGLRLETANKLNKRTSFVIAIKSEELAIDITVIGKAKWIKKYDGAISYGMEIKWISDENTYRRYIEILEEADRLY